MIVRSFQDIELLREGGKTLNKILYSVLDAVRPGVSAFTLDEIAQRLIYECGAIAIFKGYGARKGHMGFPGAVCVSINDEVVHGIPNEKKVIREGDIVKVDIGMRYKGLVTDMARTVAVGHVSNEAKRLIETTKASLDAGIAAIRVGAKLTEYGRAVERYAKKEGFSVVRDLVGHGVGLELHEDPQIPNYVDRKMMNFVFSDGMTVALEPMINIGDWRVKLDQDGWTFRTADGSLSAHFEDTVIISKEGVTVVTRGEGSS